jgi:hypothetical protein
VTSSGRECAVAVVSEVPASVSGSAQDWGPEGVEVFETMAQVRYDGETVFLTRVGDSWRVWAAACERPAAARTYDCSVQGG